MSTPARLSGSRRLQVIDAIMDLAPIERIAEKSGVSYDTVKTLVRRWRFPQPQKQVVVKDPRVAKRALLGVSRVEAKLHKTEKELARLKAGLLKVDKKPGRRQSNQDSGTSSAAPPSS